MGLDCSHGFVLPAYGPRLMSFLSGYELWCWVF